MGCFGQREDCPEGDMEGVGRALDRESQIPCLSHSASSKGRLLHGWAFPS